MNRSYLLPLALFLFACEPIDGNGNPLPNAEEQEAVTAAQASTESLGAALSALQTTISGDFGMSGRGLSPAQDRPPRGNDEAVPGHLGERPSQAGCATGVREEAHICEEAYPSLLGWTWTDCATRGGDLSTGNIQLASSFELLPTTATCESFDGVDWSADLSYDVSVAEASGANSERDGTLSLGATFDDMEKITAARFGLSFTNHRELDDGTVTEDNSISGNLDLAWDDPLTELRVTGDYMYSDTVAGRNSSATLTDAAFVEGCCVPVRGDATITLQGGTTVNVTFGPTCGAATIGGLIPYTFSCAQ